METIPEPAPSEELLRREQIIRYTGILLLFTPLGNFLLSAFLTHSHGWWRLFMLRGFARELNASFWILSALNFFAGALMIKGKRESWISTLCVIGVTILFNLSTFRRDILDGWLQPTLSMVINCAFFGLIYSQEVHQRLQRKLLETAMKMPFSRGFNRCPKIDYGGNGPWAEITAVTQQGLRIRSLTGKVPEGIEWRDIELELEPGFLVQVRFLERSGGEYLFRFIHLTPQAMSRIRKWARIRGPATPPSAPPRRLAS
jgi:hypothetical protein